MIKIIKKLAITSLLAMSVMAVMPVGASAQWKQDGEKNYYWIESGEKAKGWRYINNEWYYFSNDGKMQISWIEDNGNWYYLWSNGMMAHDTWLNRAGGWYYFDSTGKMIYDSTVIGPRKYDFTQPVFIISKDLDNTSNAGATVAAENKTANSTDASTNSGTK